MCKIRGVDKNSLIKIIDILMQYYKNQTNAKKKNYCGKQNNKILNSDRIHDNLSIIFRQVSLHFESLSGLKSW